MGNCCAQNKPSSESLRGGNNCYGLYDNCICESLSTALSIGADDFMCLEPRACGEKSPHLSELKIYPSVHILRELSKRVSNSRSGERHYLTLLEDKGFIDFDKDRNVSESPSKKIKPGGNKQKLRQAGSKNSELPKPVLLNLTDDDHQSYGLSKPKVNWRCKAGPMYVTPVEVDDFVNYKKSDDRNISAQECSRCAEQEGCRSRFSFADKSVFDNESFCGDEVFKPPSSNWGSQSQTETERCIEIGGDCALNSILEKIIQNAVLSKVTIEGLSDHDTQDNRRINKNDGSNTYKNCTVFIDGDPYPMEKIIFIPKIKPSAGDYLATKCTLDTNISSRVLLISTDFLPTSSRTPSRDGSYSSKEREGTPISIQSVPVRRLKNNFNCRQALSTPNLKPLPFVQTDDRPFTYANICRDWCSSSEEGQSISKSTDIPGDDNKTESKNLRPYSNDVSIGRKTPENNLRRNTTSCCSRRNEFLFVRNKKAHAKSDPILYAKKTKIRYSSIGKLFNISEPSSGNISQKSSFLYIKRCNLSSNSKREGFLRILSRKRRSQYLSVPQDLRESE